MGDKDIVITLFNKERKKKWVYKIMGWYTVGWPDEVVGSCGFDVLYLYL